MRIHQWLKVLAERKGSDLYLTTGAPPCAKFERRQRLDQRLAG